MRQEIERKFLVSPDWKPTDKGLAIAQGYLATEKSSTVRVRLYGDKGYLTIKGKTEGISRAEYEYEIPVDDAKELLKLCKEPPIEKTRYLENYNGHTFEVDVFHGKNAPLVLAEVELASPEENFSSPPWLGEEVSADERYFNAYLACHPYGDWQC